MGDGVQGGGLVPIPQVSSSLLKSKRLIFSELEGPFQFCVMACLDFFTYFSVERLVFIP